MPGTSVPSDRKAPPVARRRADAWRATAVCGLLVLAVALVYGQTLRHAFINYDDSTYVFGEPHVSGGLSWSGMVWAFTRGPVGEWYPLAMLSHMLDCQLYGSRPGGHHLTNVLLHAASSVVLFLVLWRMTAALWPSALVAGLFALHPLRVESVAWVAERRDVLSGLFFMLTLGAYEAYVRHGRSLGRYLVVAGLFALGLLAKPMLVTLPPLLLLLDYWPLGRLFPVPPDAAAPIPWPAGAARKPPPRPSLWGLVMEKLPLMALALAAAAMTMRTHSSRHDPLSLAQRLANAAISYVAYLGQLFVPVGLSPFYSHPEAGWPAWQVAAAVALLLAITAAAVILWRSAPYFFVGWFWYVGMLVPVLGLTHVGTHARADRYTYLSQIGLYLALVWGAKGLAAAWPARQGALAVGSVLALAALMAVSWWQTGYWQNSQTLWQHALACDPGGATPHLMLAMALRETDESAAVEQYRKILSLGPNERNIYYWVRAMAADALGEIAAKQGDLAEAGSRFEQALECDPGFVTARMNLGDLLAKEGSLAAAADQFRRSSELQPGNASILCSLALAEAQLGKTDEAIADFRQAAAIDPNSGTAQTQLGILLAERGEVDEAVEHFRRAIDVDPDAPLPYFRIIQLLRGKGNLGEAARYEAQAKQASRRWAETENRRGAELAEQGKLDEAIAEFQQAIAAAPDFSQAHCNLADALARRGLIDEAIAEYRKALSIDPKLAPAREGLRRLTH